MGSRRPPCRRYPTLRKSALTADFTYENFCQEAAEELLRVKDLEKRLEHYNLMAEWVMISISVYQSKIGGYAFPPYPLYRIYNLLIYN